MTLNIHREWKYFRSVRNSTGHVFSKVQSVSQLLKLLIIMPTHVKKIYYLVHQTVGLLLIRMNGPIK